MTAQLALDMAARDRILTAHQRKELVRWLEYCCYRACSWMNDGTDTPVSVNTARAILKAHDLEFPDTRFLGGVFPVSRWEQVGEVTSDSGKCHARKIRQFLPRGEIEEVKRPGWCDA